VTGRPNQVSLSASKSDPSPCVRYNINVNLNDRRCRFGALLDRGANGTIIGSDMRIIETTMKVVDLSGVDDHTVNNLRIVQAGAVTRTQWGEVIIIVNQGAFMPEGRTILSCIQLEHFKCHVNDKPLRITKQQPCITTIEGYKIPMEIRRGLPYIKLRPYTDEEFRDLPHIILTSPHDWNPSIMDDQVDDDWYKTHTTKSKYYEQGIFDGRGGIRNVHDDDDDNTNEGGDEEDRKYKAIDRAGIHSHFMSLIQDEITESDDDSYDQHSNYQAFPTTRSRIKKGKTKTDPRASNKSSNTSRS
jgi:hypothetical protein